MSTSDCTTWRGQGAVNHMSVRSAWRVSLQEEGQGGIRASLLRGEDRRTEPFKYTVGMDV